ncbi:uncharacterized protein LOC135218909 [Macrobrachium nipponense]|uniref:uncharacterized protein LOC135218909 n=1 Tax=Macrobrachium nipponense TaxID=159736 RepID=UPI0030C7C2CE
MLKFEVDQHSACTSCKGTVCDLGTRCEECRATNCQVQVATQRCTTPAPMKSVGPRPVVPPPQRTDRLAPEACHHSATTSLVSFGWVNVVLEMADNSTSKSAKTRDKIRSIRSLTVVVQPAVASDHGFQELQFVKISTCDRSQPALLVIDGKIMQNVSIVNESCSDLLFQGEEITVTSPCLRLIAEEVSLLPISHKDIGDLVSFTEYLKQQLIMRNFVIQADSNIIIQYLSQDIVLKIMSIRNFGSDTDECQVPAECIWQTRVMFESHSRTSGDKGKHEITFSDVGGYKLEIENLKKEIGRLFSIEKSTVKAVKGILISGPAGCGKSLIGKALKSEYKDKFICIDLDSTKSRFQGETEMNLRQQFTRQLNRAPCLVFIDDIDILCTSRDRGDNSGIVTTLLHLIDGLNTSADGILVVATATKPQTLDAALRRPGRLSYDIFLSVPEECDREDILQKMLDK